MTNKTGIVLENKILLILLHIVFIVYTEAYRRRLKAKTNDEQVNAIQSGIQLFNVF